MRFSQVRALGAAILFAVSFGAPAAASPRFDKLEETLKIRPEQKEQFDAAVASTQRALVSVALIAMPHRRLHMADAEYVYWHERYERYKRRFPDRKPAYYPRKRRWLLSMEPPVSFFRFQAASYEAAARSAHAATRISSRPPTTRTARHCVCPLIPR